jgi:predicted DNA-binding ribbon-helix-helix protein
MAAARQGLPVRLDRAPQRASRRARTRSIGSRSRARGIGSRSRARGSSLIFDRPPAVAPEDAFWDGLKEIGGERRMTLSDLVAAIDAQRQHGNLSSAIRLFVLDFYRAQISGAKEGDNRTHEMAAHPDACLFLIHKSSKAALRRVVRLWPSLKSKGAQNDRSSLLPFPFPGCSIVETPSRNFPSVVDSFA